MYFINENLVWGIADSDGIIYYRIKLYYGAKRMK
mgnify:CR=1 FL=1